MKLQNILNEELKKISLNNQETNELKKTSNEFIKRISAFKVKSFIGGSLAKGTLIKKPINASKSLIDIDIFAVFKSESEIQNLKKALKKAGFKFEVLHGSRDYFHISAENVLLEIVPVVKIKKNKAPWNITDYSLSHVSHIKSKIKKNPKLAGEIKLAKAFCQAQKCYGAEGYIKGFSGYSLELLVCHYKSFIKFLKEMTKSKKKTIIDPEKKFKKQSSIMSELNESKLNSPIILIDPTYKYRNACAGLSKETFAKFLGSASKFLKSPSLKFFEEKKADPDFLKNLAKKKKAKLIQFNLKTSRQRGDIAAAKMKKFFEFIINELKRKEQKILLKEFEYSGGENAIGYLIIKEKNEIEIKGPETSMKKASEQFKKTRKQVYTRKNRLYSKEKIHLEKIFNYLRKFEDNMGVNFEVIQKMKQSQKIKAIIFDVGGVLYTEQDPAWKYMMLELNLNREDWFEKIVAPLNESAVGKLTGNEVLKKMSENIKFDKTKLKKLWKKAYGYPRLNEGLINIVKKLRNNYKLAVLSNQWPPFHRLFITSNLTKYFDLTVISNKVGLKKPDIKIYEYTLSKLKLKPFECLFIDDVDKNLVSAKELGMNVILFKNNTQLIKELKRFKVLQN